MLNTLPSEILIERLRKLNTPLIATVILLLLGIGIAVTGYHSIRRIFFPVTSTAIQAAYRPIKRVNVQALKTYHLLGVALVSTGHDIPLSQLGYTVNAILLNNKGVGQALIVVQGKIILAKVNTPLAPGVTVSAINATNVIVSNHGRLGKLEMIAPLNFSNQKPPATLFSNNSVKVIR